MLSVLETASPLSRPMAGLFRNLPCWPSTQKATTPARLFRSLRMSRLPTTLLATSLDRIGLGWGGYDKLAQWQASGRQVTKDMMEEEEWTMDVRAPLEFVNESDEPILTVPVEISDDLLPRSQLPPTLYQLLNEGDEQNPKASPTSSTQPQLAPAQD